MKSFIPILFAAALLAACVGTKQSNKSQVTDSIPSAEVTETKNAEKPQETEKSAEENTKEAIEEKHPVYKLNKANWAIERLDGSEEKNVLITIDDAPDKHSLEMAEILNRLGVKAIFFVNGHFLDTPEEEQRLKKIHDMGFAIGNHTYSHKNMTQIPEEEQKQEIVSLNDRVKEIIGVSPAFFRAPFGMNTDYSKEIAAQEGMLLMNWTYGYDWEKQYQTPDSLAEIMITSPYLTNGANLLMHDREWTKDALESIVKGLQAKGYSFADPTLIEVPKE
ncbi:polysaccharide deacetylase family protein [Neobacillus piezotolerans]|uniref:Polysaccharide deacetylase family protein n=1 Tax=Neobacillus piezotolerans TaxID=2259171 RepID=A0A3D8GW55_9BACI|nr:polysaccharide deacetylase family protein [Neobacillus piezotolerans]RDU38697.1 polysaccharide deacetylase family protein [Neobacillus piezotolerans]